MAHLAKFSGGVEGAKLYAHWSREQDENGDYITYSREHGGGHINRELTKNNFTIGEIHNRDWVAERLKNVYQKPNQKKPVETCDIIVTLPQSESKDLKNVKQFMQAAYNSLKKQYGNNNNIVGCWVHMDEAQPHLHFAFLPISERNSKQKPEYKEKLSTRAYWPKKNSLQEMHRVLQKDIDKDMGRHIEGINDGITKEQGGNKTIIELKTESKREQEKLNKLQEKTSNLAKRIELARHDDKTLDSIRNQVEFKTKTLSRKEYVEMPIETYNRLISISEHGINGNVANLNLKAENLELKGENSRLKTALSDERAKAFEKMGGENSKLKEQNSKLIKENKALKSQNHKIGQIQKQATFLKNFIQENGQAKEFNEWYKGLPNNVKEASADALDGALKDWNLMSQARREDEKHKELAKLI